MAMFPVFDVAYYIVSILYLKYEPGAVEVSRKSPVASWLCAMLYCFGSYILADIMLGVSPIDYFHNNSHILLASAFFLHHIIILNHNVYTIKSKLFRNGNSRDISNFISQEYLLFFIQAFMTARHSHGSPVALIESWLCHLLFGSPLGIEDAHDPPHAAPAAAPLSPAKTKEELSEGTRKRKPKKE
uniref:Trimeric intracellular cation channel type A n=1 Tax=Sinocyclocheilus grahami TaxID=75366 RepID=A0A672K5X2_SINGR